MYQCCCGGLKAWFLHFSGRLPAIPCPLNPGMPAPRRQNPQATCHPLAPFGTLCGQGIVRLMCGKNGKNGSELNGRTKKTSRVGRLNCENTGLDILDQTNPSLSTQLMCPENPSNFLMLLHLKRSCCKKLQHDSHRMIYKSIRLLRL